MQWKYETDAVKNAENTKFPKMLLKSVLFKNIN